VHPWIQIQTLVVVVVVVVVVVACEPSSAIGFSLQAPQVKFGYFSPAWRVDPEVRGSNSRAMWGAARTNFVPETDQKSRREMRTDERRCIGNAAEFAGMSNERLEVFANPNHRRPDDPEAL
jgi:hypothetical protein